MTHNWYNIGTKICALFVPDFGMGIYIHGMKKEWYSRNESTTKTWPFKIIEVRFYPHDIAGI